MRLERLMVIFLSLEENWMRIVEFCQEQVIVQFD